MTKFPLHSAPLDGSVSIIAIALYELCRADADAPCAPNQQKQDDYTGKRQKENICPHEMDGAF